MIRKSTLAALLLATALPLAAGCSDSDNTVTGPSPAGGAANSTLRINLTDKPAEEYQEVNVTITSLRIHQSASAGGLEAGWLELPVTAQMPVDLLVLRNGVLLKLCEQQIPAGHYQQVRLELAPNTGSAEPFNQYVVLADGTKHPLSTPSASIKIVHGIALDPNQVTELTLDFDASKSVQKQGNGTYSLKPVIKGL